jgi:prepilin-type N-terminal cleavage/methylation domain-containing protein
MLRSKTMFLDSQAHAKMVILFWNGYRLTSQLLYSYDKHMRLQQKNQAGFTLLELVVVLLIVCILVLFWIWH